MKTKSCSRQNYRLPALRGEVRGEVVGGLVREHVEQDAALVEGRQEVSAEVEASPACPAKVQRASPQRVEGGIHFA